MSSREIAELCEKEHRHVLRDIRAYVGAIVQMERGIDVRSMDWDGKEGVELFEHTPYTHEQNGQTLTADDQYDEQLNGLTRRSR